MNGPRRVAGIQHGESRIRNKLVPGPIGSLKGLCKSAGPDETGRAIITELTHKFGLCGSVVNA